MDIRINNVSDPSTILVKTRIPTIVNCSQWVSGTYAQISLTVNENFWNQVSFDNQFYLTILGETITNVLDIKNATNKRFYISASLNDTAFQMAQALRNCPRITADFIVYYFNNQIILKAKEIGSKWSMNPNFIDTSIPSRYVSISTSDGTQSSDLIGGKVVLDIFNDSRAEIDTYVTTLEKNWHGNEVNFDISPILSTFTEYGETHPFLVRLYEVYKDGTVNEGGNAKVVTSNAIVGYMGNNSEKYIDMTTTKFLLPDIKRYTYYNIIDFSTLIGTNVGGWTTTLTLFDNVGDTLWTYSFTTQSGMFNTKIADQQAAFDESYFKRAQYAEIAIGNTKYRWEIIKPLKATEVCHRVYWRNEDGGIDFFDFTGQISESESIDIETYETNIWDYYGTNAFERNKIYSNNIDKTIRYTSHLIEEAGKPIFDSLIKSQRIWTYIEGKLHYIIPTGLTVEEDATYNGLYKAQFSFKQSIME